MKIDISKNEYRDLMDILSIADWVLNAYKEEDDPKTERYGELEQKFYAYAKEMGFDDLIEFAPELEMYFPTRKYEDTGKYWDFVDDFENDLFWDELIHRLVERDLIKQEGGVENVMKLSMEERIKKEAPLEKKYSAEFEANGLDNLKID